MGLQIRNSFFDECGFGLVLGLGSCDSVFFLQIMLRQAPKLPLCNAGNCEIAPSGDAWNVPSVQNRRRQRHRPRRSQWLWLKVNVLS